VDAVVPDGPGRGFQGVWIDGQGGCLNVVAFDGTRLAHDVLPNCGEEGQEFGIPLKASRLLQRLCADADGDIAIQKNARSVRFTVGEWTVRAQCVEGSMIDYTPLLNERPGDPVMFDPHSMRAALGRLAIMSDNYSKGVKFELTPDKATLSLVNQKLGEAVEEVPVGYEGPPATLGYSLPFLRDALRQIPEDDAEMWIGTDIKRATFTSRCGGTNTHIIGPFAV
jgi:DNA polymerase-3 subunit beta